MGSLGRRRRRCSAGAVVAAATLCADATRPATAWLARSDSFLRPATACATLSTATTRRLHQCSSFGLPRQRRRSMAIMASNDDDAISKNLNDYSMTNRSTSRVGGRRLTGLVNKAEQPAPSNMDVARTAITITAATVLSVLLVDDITMRFETVQDWRYAWPLVGTLYVVTGMSSWVGTNKNNESGVLGNLEDTTDQLTSIVPLPSNRWVRGLAALAGVGVLAGGYMDAFFPVWYTSPDLLGTRAGIEADSAAILLLLTVGSIATNINKYCSLKLERNDNDDSESNSNALELPSLTVAVVLCTQLWEIASATFYSWGELLGIVS